MEANPEEPTITPVKDDCVKENPVKEESTTSSLDRVKG
jgi:hypothetical protein